MRVDDTSHGSEALIAAIRAALARRRDSGNPNGPVPEEARQGVLTLLRGGMSVQRIAEQTELSETTIFRWRAFSPAVKPPTVFSVLTPYQWATQLEHEASSKVASPVQSIPLPH